MSDEVKVCGYCYMEKAIQEFVAPGGPSYVYRPYCNGCDDIIQERQPGQRMRYVVPFDPPPEGYVWRRGYGIYAIHHESLVHHQHGRCAICGQPELAKDANGQRLNLIVDHNHANGLVRGLLCRACNLGLGHFHDDPRLLLAASDYIKHPPSLEAPSPEKLAEQKALERQREWEAHPWDLGKQFEWNIRPPSFANYNCARPGCEKKALDDGNRSEWLIVQQSDGTTLYFCSRACFEDEQSADLIIEEVEE